MYNIYLKNVIVKNAFSAINIFLIKTLFVITKHTKTTKPQKCNTDFIAPKGVIYCVNVKVTD